MKTRAQKIIVAITAVIVAGLVCATLIIAFGGQTAQVSEEENNIVNTATVTLGDMENSISSKGSIIAGSTQSVRMPLDCEIVNILIKAGEAVNIGDAFAELDTGYLQEKLDEFEILYSDKIAEISGITVDEQRINILSPIDGVVSDKHL